MSSQIVLASDRLSESLAIEKGHMIATIKAQCFKGSNPERISDTQLAAYVQVSQALMAQAPKFNPLLPGFLYAYPDKSGGITPIVGPDGIFALLASSPDIEGWSARFEKIDGELACTATIKHKRLGDMSKTCFLSEWAVTSNPNWDSRPRHMLEIRTLKHCARQVIHGMPMDADEYELAKANRGFEHALPVEETPAEEAKAAEVKATRPKRVQGVTAAKPVEAAPADPAVEAKPADLTLAAPKRPEVAAQPEADTHAATVAAEADAAFADAPDDVPEEAQPKKTPVAEVKYPAVLVGTIKTIKQGPNGSGVMMSVNEFTSDTVEGVIPCYAEVAKLPALHSETAAKFKFELKLEQRPQKAPKPPVIFIVGATAKPLTSEVAS